MRAVGQNDVSQPTPADLRKWLFAHVAEPGASVRLVCFPYGGGGASIYRTWQEKLGSQIDVCAVQLPGRENRAGEEPFRNVDVALDAIEPVLKALLDKPLVFFGYSMGAVLAYAAAARLEERHGICPRRVICCARSAPFRELQAMRPEQSLDDDFVDYVVALGGTSESTFRAPGMREMALKLWRADFELSSSLDCSERTVLKSPLLVVGGADDHTTPTASLEAWRRVTDGVFEMKILAGGHFFLHSNGPEILDLVRSAVR